MNLTLETGWGFLFMGIKTVNDFKSESGEDLWRFLGDKFLRGYNKVILKKVVTRLEMEGNFLGVFLWFLGPISGQFLGLYRLRFRNKV